MEIMTIPESQLRRRLNTIPLPKDLKSEILSVFLTSVQHSGPVWTVSRFKEMKSYVAHSVSHGKEDKSLKPKWFATTPYGNLSGAFGVILKQAIKFPKTAIHFLNLLNIYTTLKFKVVPMSLIEEARVEIQQMPGSIPTELIGFIHMSPLSWGKELSGNKRLPLARLSPSVPFTVVPPIPSQARNLSDDLEEIRDSQLVCWSEMREWLSLSTGIKFQDPGVPDYTQSTILGSVHFKGEPGLKVRYYASPNLWVQRSLEPLKEHLMDIVKLCPWDCTFDQRKADHVISHCLSKSKYDILSPRVYSFDLSKATDNFPWRLQRPLLVKLLFPLPRLRELVGDQSTGIQARLRSDPVETLVREIPLVIRKDSNWSSFILFCYMVEEAKWKVKGNHRDCVKWRTGQPLGLGPSFPLFTLTHGLLLWYLNGRSWDKKFFVLGDDLVILDFDLAMKYKRAISQLHVKVSQVKSMSSRHMAQFAGSTFLYGKRFYTPPWHEIRLDNKLDLAAYWYPGLLERDKDEKLISWVLSLPPPWGMGINPKGYSLSQRLTPEVLAVICNSEESPIPSSVTASVHKLVNLQDNWWDKLHLLSQETLPYVPRKSTRLPFDNIILSLMEGTDIMGAPRLRSRRVDPWSLGRLSYWRKLQDLMPQ